MKPAFSQKELEIIGWNMPLRQGDQGSPIFKRPITPKENLQMLFRGETPYWMPVVGMRGWDLQVFRPRMFPDNYATHLVYDAEPPIVYDSNIQKGWFDLEWEFVPAAGGATVHPGKPKVPSMAEWEKYISLPDLSQLDWEACARINKEYLHTDSMTQIAYLSCLWERLISLMDVENAAVALIDEDEKEGIHRFFDQLCDQYDIMIGKAKEYFDIDMVLWHDDWGTQASTFFSPAVHREMILPYIKRIVDSCHKRGIFFELHSCGKNETMVPHMIEAGVDLWQGQNNNDFKMLAQKYRNEKIVFGVPCPVVPENADKEEIYKIAEDFLKEYEGCRVVINCLFAYPAQMLGEALYELSRKMYL